MKQGDYIEFIFHYTRNNPRDEQIIGVITEIEDGEPTHINTQDLYNSSGNLGCGFMHEDDYKLLNHWTPEEFIKIHPEYMI